MAKPKQSIVATDLDNCFCCGRPADDTHHIFGASNRPLSEIYLLVIPVCRYCHNEIHYTKQIMDELHQAGQMAFNKAYPDKNFLKIFGQNYL